jgi:acyl-CoA reductase-like NAD-dependent aldehyde dehydrogenase
VPIGRAVMKAAADTLKPVIELGGKNALIDRVASKKF